MTRRWILSAAGAASASILAALALALSTAISPALTQEDSGEERGLRGTRHFVHRPPVPLDSIVAHVNIDMIGANRAPGSVDSVAMEVTGPDEVYLTGPRRSIRCSNA